MKKVLGVERRELERRLVEVLTRLLANALGLSREDRRCIGFSKSEDAEEKADTAKGHAGPVDVSPTGSTDLNGPRDDWPNGGSGKGRHGEEGEGHTSRFGIPDVSDETTGVGQRRSSEDAAQETEDENGSRIGRQRAAHVPDRVHEDTDDEDWFPTQSLRERSPNERSEAVTSDPERDGERGHLLGKGEVSNHLGHNAARA